MASPCRRCRFLGPQDPAHAPFVSIGSGTTVLCMEFTNAQQVSTSRVQRTSTGANPAAAVVAIIGGLVAAVSSLLPWFTASVGLASINRNAFQFGQDDGFSIDGVILMFLGVVGILIGVTNMTRTAMPRFLARSPIWVGIGVGVEAFLQISPINNLKHNVTHACSFCSGSFGYGLYVAFVGAVLLVVAGLMLRSNHGAIPAPANYGTGGSPGGTYAAPPSAAPGWYQDPWGTGMRWWDGQQWTVAGTQQGSADRIGPPGQPPPVGTLSTDGQRFWNGTGWVSALSSDGRSRWTGQQWTTIEPPPGSMGT